MPLSKNPDYFLLSDIEGVNPQRSFEIVLKGAELAFDAIADSISCLGIESDFDSSKLKQIVHQLKPYVIEHKYSFGNSEPLDEDIINELFGPCHTLYTLWKWSLEPISNFGSSTMAPNEYRYFSLFVQGAWWRLNVDCDVGGDYGFKRSPRFKSPLNGITLFTDGNLSLLCSLELNASGSGHKKSIDKSIEKIRGKKIYRKAVELNDIQTLQTPVTPEFEYYNRGRKPSGSDFHSRDTVIGWLKGDMKDTYTFTDFS
ncbi:MAG: hypothetical protein JKX76_03180 [Colwellia sp.]|nr:hypothetical protein [Colwellia sp.]